MPRHRRKNKFGNIKKEVDGIVFDSTKEANRYSELKLLELGGEIKSLDVHPRFKFEIDGKPLKYPNGRQAVYTADFQYIEPGKGVVVEDCKSKATKTEAYALRTTLFRALFPNIVFIET